MTLRKLVWMVTAALRHRGELAAWHASTIVAHIPLSGRTLRPAEINPYRNVGRRESAALRRIKAKIASMTLSAIAGGPVSRD